jgi:hypothetical protein
MAKQKRGISYVEIFIAFSIFLIGLSVVAYFFIPFFRPEYRNALNEMQKRFEENFMARVDWYSVVVNDSGCINITKLQEAKNIYFFYKNLTAVNFSISNGITLDVAEKELYMLNSSLDLGSSSVSCNAKPAEATYIKIYDEKILNESAINAYTTSLDYQTLRNMLLPGFNVDFNITVGGQSFGKPLPSINIFAKEKVYKKIKDGQIDYVKVRFYVW